MDMKGGGVAQKEVWVETEVWAGREEVWTKWKCGQKGSVGRKEVWVGRKREQEWRKYGHEGRCVAQKEV